MRLSLQDRSETQELLQELLSCQLGDPVAHVPSSLTFPLMICPDICAAEKEFVSLFYSPLTVEGK